MPKQLYLIRHTRPDIAPGICYGQLDPDVADSFEQEAQCLQSWLPPLDLVISSSLLRTRRLAEHLAGVHGCELRGDARLMEKHFGRWEGQDWDDIPRSEIDAWAADVMDYAAPGGESARQLQQRVEDFMSDLALLPHQGIAIVAHGGSIRAMLALLAGIPLERTLNWQLDYGTVVTVRP